MRRFKKGDTVRINLNGQRGNEVKPLLPFNGKTARVRKVWSWRGNNNLPPLYTLWDVKSRYGVDYTFINDYLEGVEKE